MSLTRFHCPECGQLLRYSDPVPSGSTVRCVYCRLPITVPQEDVAPATPPEPVREVLTARRQEVPVPAVEADSFPSPVNDLNPAYRVELGRWFRAAQAHYGAVLGQMLIWMVVQGAIVAPLIVLVQVLSLLAAAGDPTFGLVILVGGITLVQVLMTSVLSAGFVVVALAQLRGRPWSFSTFFGGFRSYGELVAASLIVSGVSALFAVPTLLIGTLIVKGSPDFDVETLAILGVLCVMMGTYFVVRLSYFAVPLIVDRRFGAVEALQGSWRLTGGHLGALVLVCLVFGVAGVIGLALGGVGYLLGFPLLCLTYSAGYLAALGESPSVPGHQERDHVVDLEHAGRVTR